MDWLHAVLTVLSVASSIFGILAKRKEGKTKDRYERTQEVLDTVIDGVETYSEKAGTRAAKQTISAVARARGTETALRSVVKNRT